MPPWTNEDQEKFNELVRQLQVWAFTPCCNCQASLLREEVLYSNAMGFKTAPRCLGCLACGLKTDPTELKDNLINHIRRRACLRKAYELVCGLQLMQEDETADKLDNSSKTSHPTPDFLWDAGELGCGDLVLLLRSKLRKLLPGKILHLTALDPAAPLDIPAWCNLTGNTLLASDHPNYFIKNKD